MYENEMWMPLEERRWREKLERGEKVKVGEIADEMIDAMLFGHNNNQYIDRNGMHRHKNLSPRQNKIVETVGNKMYNRPNGYPDYEKDIKKVFKLHTGEYGSYSVVVEQGIQKEAIVVSFDRSKYRAKGFIVAKESLFNSNQTAKEVINMQDVFTSLVHMLNNLYSADLLIEKQYNALIDGFEPFIYEAIDFSEFETYLEPSGINDKKKKRISRRDRK